MIDDDLRVLLSAYLDDELSAAEKSRIEALLQKDPAVQEELAAQKAWRQQIDLSRPAQVAAPAGFRESVMAKIKAAGQGPDPEEPDAGNSPSPWTAPTIWIAGSVLVALIGTLALVDSLNHKKITTAELAAKNLREQLQPTILRQDAAAPEFRGSASADESRGLGVNPDDIQSDEPAQSAEAMALGGKAYQFGQSSAAASGKKAAGPIHGTAEEVVLAPQEGMVLESTEGWTKDRVEQCIIGPEKSRAAVATNIFTLAQQFNLNPALLVTAAVHLPQTNPGVLAQSIRIALDASVGQTAEQRLQHVIRQLGSDPARLADWQKDMRRFSASTRTHR